MLGVDLKSKDTNKGRFYNVGDNVWYPSITTILGAQEKPALVNWRNALGPVKADKKTKQAADRGTAVHNMIERWLEGDPNPTHEHINEHIRHFNQLKLHLKRIKSIRCQEKALFSDILRAAGRVDCIAEYDGELSIIDFKTSNQEKHESWIKDYFLQTTAYALMVEEMYEIKINQVVILMSTDKGAAPMVFKRNPEQYEEELITRIMQFHNKGIVYNG